MSSEPDLRTLSDPPDDRPSGDRPTADEIGDSLTGWEEIAITKACGQPLATIGEVDPVMTVRLLVAVAEARRRAVPYPEAYRAAMDMTQREVLEYFPSDVDAEMMPEDPVTEPGKDGTRPGGTPNNLPHSVLSQESPRVNTTP